MKEYALPRNNITQKPASDANEAIKVSFQKVATEFQKTTFCNYCMTTDCLTDKCSLVMAKATGLIFALFHQSERCVLVSVVCTRIFHGHTSVLHCLC